MKKKIITEFIILYSMILALGFCILPVNGRSIIWYIDGIGQYYPAFLYVGQYLRHFFADLIHFRFSIPVFDLDIGMGEDVIGVLNYYGFGDPINILAVLADKNNGYYLFAFSYFLRLIMAGATFCHYCRIMKLSGEISVLGAVAYSFCGFALYGGIRYIEWTSVLVYFPLMISGAERILKGKINAKELWLGVCYGSLCGFYYLYMSSLGLALYCIVRVVFVFGKRGLTTGIKRIMICLFHYVLAILIASPILIPALEAFFNSERTGISHNVFGKLKNYIPSLKLIKKAFIDSVIPSESDFLGVLFIEWICALCLFVLLPKNQKNKQLLLGFSVCLLSVSIPMVSWLFNGFGETNDRWVFLLHFFMAVLLVSVLSDITQKCGWTKKKSIRSVLGAVLMVCVAGNIVFNVWGLFGENNTNWQAEMIPVDRTEVYVDSPYNYSAVLKSDEDIFRISNSSLTSVNERPENVAMINGYSGCTYWFSLINSETQKFVDKCADSKLNWRSYGFEDKAEVEAVSAVKYSMVSEIKEDSGDYELVDEVVYNDKHWYIYRNLLYKGLCYFIKDKEYNYDEHSFDDYIDDVFGDMSNEGIYNTSYSEGKFSCIVNIDRSKRLVIALPYHNNWKIRIDGKDAQLSKEGMFCAVSVSQGVHQIELKYTYSLMTLKLLLVILGVSGILAMKVITKGKIQRCYHSQFLKNDENRILYT